MPLIPTQSQVVVSNKDLLTAVNNSIEEGFIKASEIVDHFSASSLEEVLYATVKILPKDQICQFIIDELIKTGPDGETTLNNIREALYQKNRELELQEFSNEKPSLIDMLSRVLRTITDGTLALYIKEHRLPKEFIKVLLDIL